MTLKELFSVATFETSIDYVARDIDGKDCELTAISGKLYENLDDCEYWIDLDFTSDEENDLITGYDALFKTEELLNLEVIYIQVNYSFTTIYLKNY